MADKPSRPPRRKRQQTEEPDVDQPPLGPDGKRAEPLQGRPPAIQRDYDPGFKPPDDDADPWQDEGHPEASG
jgi:hypothetical protein